MQRGLAEMETVVQNSGWRVHRDTLDGGEDVRIDMIDNAAVAFGGGMKAVRLVVVGIAGNSLQKKRDQGDRVFSGNFRINIGKGPR